MEEKGILVIDFHNSDTMRVTNFDYYTMQHPFLVIAFPSGTVEHFHSDTIKSFTYTITKEIN